MADDLIRLILAGDSDTLTHLSEEHRDAIRSGYARSCDGELSRTIPLEIYASTCLGWAARRAKAAVDLTHTLERILLHPQSGVFVGITNGLGLPKQFLPEDAIETQWNECRQQFKGFTLPLPEFSKGLLARIVPTAVRVGCSLEEVIEKRVRYPDVYLAVAALEPGEAVGGRARDEFTRLYYKPVALRYVKIKWGSLSMSEDKVQDLFLALLYEHFPSEKTGNRKPGETKNPALLESYRGDGPLGAWITLTLGNMIRDSLRTTRSDFSLNEERESEEGGAPSLRFEPAVPADQADEGDRGPCLKMLREGLALGWGRLKARERLTLILQTLHKVPPSLIARRIFQVHEGTITKYTTSSLEKIHSAIEEFAQRQMQLSRADVGDCFQYAREAFPETDDLAGGMVAFAARSE